ncbi:hypothetical protein FRC12_015955 [Ceratobasidium sp. 428]|nr:hypothetical protein FRC12_015955 [Ceratobasidium sp. 428]
MTDPDYQSLVLGVTNETGFGSWFGLSAPFKRYLDIASLAHRFCMDSVETWALGQFKGVMRSAKGISNSSPDYTDLFGALEYSKLTSDRELERDARNLAQCCISNINSATRTLPPNPISCNALVRIYKDPLLKQKDPALFGHAFCVVLSAGHLSMIWKALTRDDRSKLLAAQVYLTPLPSTLPTGWIHNLSEISEAVNTQSRQNCFVNCSRSFINRFAQIINGSDLLKDSPLVGVTAVSKLATHRQSMAETFKVAKCGCASQLLAAIDLKMDTLLTELAEKYHDHID